MVRIRHRFTVRWLMVTVAAVAVMSWWVIRRPCPQIVSGSVRYDVTWSDGSSSVTNGPPKFRGNSWLLIVDWADGRTGYYLKPWATFGRPS